MKILIAGFTKIKYMPYLHFYLDRISLEKHDVHILLWNRDGKEEPMPEGKITYHTFRCLQQDDVGKLSKLGSFRKYRKYAARVIRQEKPDFIIMLHSLPAVLVSDILLRQYPGKFIFDYRDYTYEGFGPFHRIVNRLVEASQSTFVSSDGFRSVLPKLDKVYTSHNLLLDSLSHREKKTNREKDRVRIGFWGFPRHEKLNRQMIRSLGGDDRFELHYYGREQAICTRLKQYAGELGAKNVFFHGEYWPEDRYDFQNQVELIHNLYSNSELPPTRLPMGNKYYDGILFYLPQLCMPGSYMGQRVREAEVGLCIDPYCQDFADRVWDYYQKLDYERFMENCDRELGRILKEYQQSAQAIDRALE